MGISIDKEPASFLRIIEKHQFNFPNLCNYKGAWEGDIIDYKVLKTPSVYLIDKTGIIMMKDIYDEKLLEILDNYFKNYEKKT